MKIEEYQKYVSEGASEKYKDNKFATLALVGEVGEVCDVVKKHEVYSDLVFDYKEKMIEELGDVLWQYTALLNSIGITFDDVIMYNTRKLKNRHGDKKLDLTGGKR